MRLARRSFLVGAAALAACSRRARSEGQGATGEAKGPAPYVTTVAAGARGSTKLLEWSFDGVGAPLEGGKGRAVIVVPTWGGPAARFPVVVALHGRGESMKPPAEGAMGWPRDYALVRAMERLCAPPIDEKDLEGFVDDERLRALNRDLSARPFGGVIVACPYVPDIATSFGDDARAYGRFIVETLLPRVVRETPALDKPDATGIDGVSLGGAIALQIGLAHTETFGAVGGIQPAVAVEDTPGWTERVRAAIGKRPTLKLRLMTSHEDYFRDAVTHLSQAWREAEIDHEFSDVPGPHDYPFNRGPGSIELLTWHDRVLSRS